jgi:hypothetical protein
MSTSLLAEQLKQLPIVPQSLTISGEGAYAILQESDSARLVVTAPTGSLTFDGLQGTISEYNGNTLLAGPLNIENAVVLRRRLSWLVPQPVGTRTSAGLGDRLGLATPGHIRAMRHAPNIAPIFAQQSIREMARTNRTPEQVLADALWGVFAEGWQAGYGADADHLKTPADIDRCLAAGFTTFTFDPGEHVDNHALNAAGDRLDDMFADLPWDVLEDTPSDARQRYLAHPISIDGMQLSFNALSLAQAAVKYGRAVAHIVKLYRHLASSAGSQAWEVEISVDETELPTSHLEHVYFVQELKRLGVSWVSLAPRFVGHFEKGVDFIGDLEALKADLSGHAAIARAYGRYKLSLHSGSDKFSVYPLAMAATNGLVHLKTAGTSYLEALRTIATHDTHLFRTIYRFARERYPTDRATYHVSASLDKAPPAEALSDHDLPELLNQFDPRQVLHVTFGSALAEFGGPIKAVLGQQRETYARYLETHFNRHLQPFVQVTP